MRRFVIERIGTGELAVVSYPGDAAGPVCATDPTVPGGIIQFAGPNGGVRAAWRVVKRWEYEPLPDLEEHPDMAGMRYGGRE